MASRQRQTREGNWVPMGRPTWYEGILFRSRLESLWARAFDEYKVEWAYEPQRYELGSMSYLPDFWLKGFQLFAEVKPVFPTFREQMMAKLLAEETGHPVYFLVGPPYAGVYSFELENGRVTTKEIRWVFPFERIS